MRMKMFGMLLLICLQGVAYAPIKDDLNSECPNTLFSGGTPITYEDLVTEVLGNKNIIVKTATFFLDYTKDSKLKFTPQDYFELCQEVQNIKNSNIKKLIEEASIKERLSFEKNTALPGAEDFYHAVNEIIFPAATKYIQTNYKDEWQDYQKSKKYMVRDTHP